MPSEMKPDPNPSLSRPAIHLPASSPSIPPSNATSPPNLKLHPALQLGFGRQWPAAVIQDLPAVGVVHPTVGGGTHWPARNLI